jgi:hypothetical protein
VAAINTKRTADVVLVAFGLTSVSLGVEAGRSRVFRGVASRTIAYRAAAAETAT